MAFVVSAPLASQPTSALQLKSQLASRKYATAQACSAERAVVPASAIFEASRFPVFRGFRSFSEFSYTPAGPIETPKFAADGGSGGAGAGGSGGNGGNGGNGDNNDGGDEESNPLKKIWAAYNQSLETRPLLTKAMTSFTGFALGDILAQNFFPAADQQGFDWARFFRMTSFGFIVHGPLGHYFYGALDGAIPGNGPKQVISKVAIDQLGWAWVFTFVFFSYLGLLEGKSPSQIVEKLKNDSFLSVSGSWKVWPVAHAINFRFIPSNQRLLYINTIQVFYNVFLSIIGSKGSAGAAEGEEPSEGEEPTAEEEKAPEAAPAPEKAEKKN
eukprot:tig00020544_g10488.t1